MIVAFPIEISAREYLSKIFCAYQILKNTDYRVVFGKKSEIYNFYKKNSGVYLITKGGTLEHFAFKKEFTNNKLSLLDEEGPLINFSYKSDFIARTNSDVLKKISDYYCWGNEDYKMMKKKKINEKLFISGHPKYDLCNRKYRIFFDDEKKLLTKKYGKFLLVASSFIGADGYIENDIYSKWIVKAVEKKNRKKKKKDLFNYFKDDQLNYKRLIDLTKKISLRYPDLKIIFRPHPRQDILKVKNRFDKNIYKNITINNEGSITPFIYSCKYYLHSGCTTSLEAALLEKKILYLKNNFKNKNLYQRFGTTIGNINQNILLDKFFNLGYFYDLKKNNIDKFIYNNKKQFFYKYLIKKLKKINLISKDIILGDLPKKNYFLSKLKEIMYDSKLLLIFFSLFNINLLLNKKYKTSKFESLDINEIKKKIKKFQIIDKVNFQFKIKKVNNDSVVLIKK